MLLLVDGARGDVFRKLLEAGELPASKALFADRGGFRDGTSVMPTVSGPAHLPPITGCYPGRCNIPGIRWFDRRLYAGSPLQPRRFRSYMGPNKVARMNREVDAAVPSVWQSFPDGVGMNCWFTRGMQKGQDIAQGAKYWGIVKAVVTRKWEARDAVVARPVIDAIRSGRRFVFAVLPTVDELGHKLGPLAEPTVEAYRAFDKLLGPLTDALAATGSLDRTLVLVTSDHGQSTTHTHVDLTGQVRKVVPRVLDFPFAWRRVLDCDAVSIVSGNALAHLSFRGPKGWTERPDVTKGPAADVIGTLLEQAYTELVVHREDGRLRVRSKGGSALLWRDGAGLNYRPDGADPMGLPPLPPTMTDDEALRLTANTGHPDALVQLEQLFWSERCGDVVVTSRAGYDLRSHWEYQDHRGSHGGTSDEHMRVPVLATTALPDRPIRTVDLFPTLLAGMGRPVPGPIDGRSLLE